MSETAIFIIGLIVFAITVYGTVMAAGTALTRIEIEENPRPIKDDAEDGAATRFPLGEY